MVFIGRCMLMDFAFNSNHPVVVNKILLLTSCSNFELLKISCVSVNVWLALSGGD